MRGRTQILAAALILWAGCASMRAPPTGTWPEVTYPGGHVQERLNEIVGWAELHQRIDVKDKALACMGHTGVNDYHCAKVYAAWALAQQAHAEPDPGKREELWQACIEELTHPPSRP